MKFSVERISKALMRLPTNRAAHVDVHKVAVHRLLDQLSHPRHLGRAAAANLNSEKILKLREFVFFSLLQHWGHYC